MLISLCSVNPGQTQQFIAKTYRKRKWAWLSLHTMATGRKNGTKLIEPLKFFSK
jgi:hypothetical protein